MYNAPMLVYNRSVANYVYDDDFNQEPPIETIISASDVKERVMDYLGAVLARCWYDKDLLCNLQINAHRALRHLGILLPDELEIFFEKKDKQRPKLIIYEWNKERTFKRKICYLQMLMMAGK